MMYKILITMSMLLGLIGCASNASVKESSLSDDTSLFKTTNFRNLQKSVSSYKYKMIYIDASDNENKELKNIFIDFGNSLGSDGVLIDFNDLSLLDKKKYLSNIFKYMNSSYEYYDSPFIIVLSKINNQLYPHKILSFSGETNDCIKKGLQRIENSIHKNIPTSTVINSINSEYISICSFGQNNEKEIKETLIDLLKIIVEGILK